MDKIIKKCEVCGITSDIKSVDYCHKAGMYLCNKHNCQFRFKGKFLDNNPRSRKDPNDYIICDDYVKMYTYNAKSEKDGEFIFDIEDLEKVLKHKWRTAHKDKDYIVTGNNRQFPITYLARYLLDCPKDLEVDHIDGNTLDNRKKNLRIANRVIQCGNLAPKYTNKIGVRGVSYSKKDGDYVVDFTYNKKRIHFKHFKDINEAVYARYMIELIANPQRYFGNDDVIESFISKLTPQQKYDIEYYVSVKALERNMVR